jgi:hypothetical protein
MADSARDRIRFYRGLLWLSVGLIVIGCAVGIVGPAGAGWDFANFYDAGQRVAAGQLKDLYDPGSRIAGGASQGTMRFWGPPISALFYVPLAWFPASTALVLFKIENVLAFAATFAVLFAFCRRFVSNDPAARLRFTALFAFLCLIFQPFWTVFRVGGQTTPTVLLLLTLALICHIRLRDWWSSALVVLATLVKPALAPALLCLLCLSGRSFAVKTFALLAVIGLASLALFGWPLHMAFLDLMRSGVQSTFPWYYNSSLYILADAVSTALGSGPDAASPTRLFTALVFLIKTVVLVTIVFLVLRSRAQRWTVAARRHFTFVVSILFFLWWSMTLWDHYLELLFIPLIYLVASDQWFSRRARILIGAMFLLSLGQNLIFVSWLRSHIESDWRSLLLAVTVLKAGPLLVMLTFVWRHYPELFDSYAAPAWNQILIPARERRS